MTYADTVAAAFAGSLSIGFVWQIAELDDVFKRYLEKVRFPQLDEAERAHIRKRADW